MNLQKIDIAGVLLVVPIPKDRAEVNEVTVMALNIRIFYLKKNEPSGFFKSQRHPLLWR